MVENYDVLLKSLFPITDEKESGDAFLSTVLCKWNQFAKEEPEYLGEGGNWVVFRVNPISPLAINDKQYDKYVLKICKYDILNKVDYYIKSFNAVYESGMKTVGFCCRPSYLENAVICEDLNDSYRNNKGGFLYVSPNTARYSNKEITVLNPIYKAIEKNKIFEISEFESTVEYFVEEMRRAGKGKKRIGVSEDVIFIGVMANHDGSVSLDYKAADFDTVCVGSDAPKENFKILNSHSIIITLREFIKYFVSDDFYGKEDYYNYLDNLITKYTL